MKILSRLSLLPLSVMLGGCMLETATEPEREEVEVGRLPIINGTLATENNFSAAVYHQQIDVNGNWYWFERPCSGVVLRQVDGYTQVLTARHCLAESGGDPRMPIVNADQLRVSTALAPGLASPEPPSSAKPVVSIQTRLTENIWGYGMKSDPNGDVDYDYWSDDLAVLAIAETLPLDPLPATDFRTLAIRMTPVQVGTSLYAEGYGQKWTTSNNGAGKLRYANGFEVQYLGTHGLAFNYQNTAGTASLWHGDSGGGDFTFETIDTVNGPLNVWSLAGIHSTRSWDGTVVTDAVPFGREEFLLSAIGFFYASPVNSPNINLCINTTTPQVASQLKANCTGDLPARNRWAFNRTTKMFEIFQEPPLFDPPPPPLCLEQQTNNLLKLHSCNLSSTRQQWEVLEDHQIQNVATGKCITFAATPTVGTCDGAATRKWLWHTHP